MKIWSLHRVRHVLACASCCSYIGEGVGSARRHCYFPERVTRTYKTKNSNELSYSKGLLLAVCTEVRHDLFIRCTYDTSPSASSPPPSLTYILLLPVHAVQKLQVSCENTHLILPLYDSSPPDERSHLSKSQSTSSEPADLCLQLYYPSCIRFVLRGREP